MPATRGDEINAFRALHEWGARHLHARIIPFLENAVCPRECLIFVGDTVLRYREDARR